MRATIQTNRFTVTASGEALAVLTVVGPFIALMMGGAGAAPPDATPGPTMQPEAVAFLAAHGFTPACFERSRKQDEDVEAFVARRELETAGAVHFSRVPPSGEKRGPTARLPPELAALKNPAAQAHEIFHFIHVAAADCDVEGCRIHPEPPPVVPDLHGMDPAKFRDGMNGITVSRVVHVAPGESRPVEATLPPELAGLTNPPATMHEIAHFIHVGGGSECAERGCRVHPLPRSSPPTRSLDVFKDGDEIAAALDEKARAEAPSRRVSREDIARSIAADPCPLPSPSPLDRCELKARHGGQCRKGGLRWGSPDRKPAKPAPRGRKAARS